jgi:hypothetical protein
MALTIRRDAVSRFFRFPIVKCWEISEKWPLSLVWRAPTRFTRGGLIYRGRGEEKSPGYAKSKKLLRGVVDGSHRGERGEGQ